MKYIIIISIFLFSSCLIKKSINIEETKLKNKVILDSISTYINDISSPNLISSNKDIIIYVSKMNDNNYLFDINNTPFNKKNLLYNLTLKDIIGCEKFHEFQICYFDRSLHNIDNLFFKTNNKLLIKFNNKEVSFYDPYNSIINYSNNQVIRKNYNLWWYNR